jgi:threonine aldolase
MSFLASHDRSWRGFASDNYAGAHPDAIHAIAAVNGGHQISYGEDCYTEQLTEVLRTRFGSPVEVFPMLTGTGANVVALQAMLERWEAVVCAQTAHLNVDEGGAPERTGGFKLLTVPTPDGKLTPQLIDTQAWGWGDQHRAQPRVVSITQSTELGTLYSVDEIRAITAHAHERGMFVHLDGARISNAVAALGTSLEAMATATGVDVVSLGGTKNGLIGAEAIVVINPEATTGIPFLRKGAMQLTSKMRYVSAQLLALYGSDLWLENAYHANLMASRLAEQVSSIPGVILSRPVQANAVFAQLPATVTAALQRDWRFYTWDESIGEVRWMTSWDTEPTDVDRFAADVARAMTDHEQRGR